jgi:hypothetical protein
LVIPPYEMSRLTAGGGMAVRPPAQICKRLRPFACFILNKTAGFVNMPNAKEYGKFFVFLPKSQKNQECY